MNTSRRYVSAGKAAAIIGVSDESLRRWAEAGKIEFVQTPGGHFRYNIDAWRKDWNRNNDTDLPERMCRAGVRMGYLPEVTSQTRPRPGEVLVGSEAYLENKSLTEQQFAF